jgi:hypothetical protein
MGDQKGWLNATKPGTPENPDQEGPHLIEDEHGARSWYWWLPDAAIWFTSSQQRSPSFAAQHWTYIGAAAEPQKVATFQRQVGEIPPPPKSWT